MFSRRGKRIAGQTVSLFWAGLSDRFVTLTGTDLPEFPPDRSAPKEIGVYYYQHHIGDFIRSTNRLNDCQCMVYLRLIWRYYESEAPLPKDPKRLAFMLGASLEDVTSILEHFFHGRR
jgi:hypothetical protein